MQELGYSNNREQASVATEGIMGKWASSGADQERAQQEVMLDRREAGANHTQGEQDKEKLGGKIQKVLNR